MPSGAAERNRVLLVVRVLAVELIPSISTHARPHTATWIPDIDAVDGLVTMTAKTRRGKRKTPARPIYTSD